MQWICHCDQRYRSIKLILYFRLGSTNNHSPVTPSPHGNFQLPSSVKNNPANFVAMCILFVDVCHVLQVINKMDDVMRFQI